MKCGVWFPLCVVACSLRSDSRARRLVGSELNCTPGKRGGGGARAREVPSPFLPSLPLPLPSLPSFFILPEFFSRALLFERLEQATCVAALTCCVHSNDCKIWLNSIKSSLKILITKMKVVIPSLTSSEHPRFVSDEKEISLRKQPPLLAAETSLAARSEDRRLFSHSRK